MTPNISANFKWRHPELGRQMQVGGGCHMPVLYRNGCTDPADFWHARFPFKEGLGSTMIWTDNSPPSGGATPDLGRSYALPLKK